MEKEYNYEEQNPIHLQPKGKRLLGQGVKTRWFTTLLLINLTSGELIPKRISADKSYNNRLIYKLLKVLKPNH